MTLGPSFRVMILCICFFYPKERHDSFILHFVNFLFHVYSWLYGKCDVPFIIPIAVLAFIYC